MNILIPILQRLVQSLFKKETYTLIEKCNQCGRDVDRRSHKCEVKHVK